MSVVTSTILLTHRLRRTCGNRQFDVFFGSTVFPLRARFPEPIWRQIPLPGPGRVCCSSADFSFISAVVPQHHRGGALSALYLVAYLSIPVVALVLGVVATARGLARAVDLGAAVITIMSIATFVLAVTARTDVWKLEGTR